MEVSVGRSKGFDPDKSVLKPGDYIRENESRPIRVVGINEGNLTTFSNDCRYLVETIEVEAATQAEAGYFLVHKLIEREIL